MPLKERTQNKILHRTTYLVGFSACLLNVLVLVILRLNLLEDLDYRFDIAKSTVSHVFSTWIDVMAIRLKFLVKWPTKEMV